MTTGIQVNDLIVTAAMFAAFGIVAFMFRVEREIRVQEEYVNKKGEPKLKSRVAWADYLIISSVGLAIIAVAALLVEPDSHDTKAFSTAACLAAAVLQLGYVPSIMAHYAINFGKPKRAEDRNPKEGPERWFVLISGLVAAALFLWVLYRDIWF